MKREAVFPQAFVSVSTPIDLTNCDREPIHTPGAIQPHGVLLALRESDYCIVLSSGNAASRLTSGRPVIGAALSDVLGAPATDAIRVALNRTHGHRQEAARVLGWGRNTLTRKLKELGMADDESLP